MKTINTLKAYINFGTKWFHLTGKKKVECKTSHGKSEEKGEFGSLGVSPYVSKGGTPIMFGPNCTIVIKIIIKLKR